MMERQRARGRRGAGRSRRAVGGVVHRRRRHQPDAQQRAPLDHAQAARAARRRRAARSSTRLQTELRAGRGHRRCTCRRCRICRSTAASSRTQYQYTLEDADPPSSRPGRRACSSRLRTLPELADVASDQQDGGPAAVADDRSRQRRAPGRHLAGHRRHALRRLRAAPGVDHLHAAQPLPRDPGGAAGVPAGPGRAGRDLSCAPPAAIAVPLSLVRALRARRRRRCRSRTRGSSPR